VLEIICIGIAVVAGYQGVLVLSRLGPPQRLYAYLLFADAGAAAATIHRGDEMSRVQEVLGAASLFGFLLLVLAPPLLRAVARFAASREHIGIAAGLTAFREHLQPGFGARQEREILDVMREVEAGRTDGALADLRARRAASAEPGVRNAIDERIVLVLLYAGRWREAIDAFEASRQAAPVPTGLQLLVELVRAYGEEGDLDKAAELVARLEELPAAHEPGLAFLFARARLLFLAFAGRPAAVAALVSPRAPLSGMSSGMRAYWIGTARLHAGDRAGARAALGAVAASDGRTGRLARERMAQVDDPAFVAPRELPPSTVALADRLAEHAGNAGRVFRLEGITPAIVPATFAILVVNVAVHVVVSLVLGTTEDRAGIIRAGANFAPAVAAGEVWRLLSSTLLHWGALHLGGNMIGLWALGRLVEQIFGSARFVVLYTLAGLGGAVASYLFGAGVSAGASGAVMGILGAAIAEMVLGRGSAPGHPSPRFRRVLLSNLLFIAAAQLAIGMAYPMIDQAAHVGGLVCGGAVGLVLGPTRGFAARLRPVVAVVAVAAAVATVAAGALAGATSILRTLDRIGWEMRSAEGVGLELPRSWDAVGPEGIDLQVRPGLAEAADQQIFLAELKQSDDVKDVSPAPPPARALPGLHALAFRYTVGGAARARIVYWRPAGAGAAAVRFDLGAHDRELLAPVIERIAASVRPIDEAR
jgi:membrane associated rhomboid family serine protease